MAQPITLLDHFSAVKGPREGWRVLYPLPEVLLLLLCATLSGMEDFVEINLWGASGSIYRAITASNPRRHSPGCWESHSSDRPCDDRLASSE